MAVAYVVGMSCPSCVLTLSSQAVPQERVHVVVPRHFRGSRQIVIFAVPTISIYSIYSIYWLVYYVM